MSDTPPFPKTPQAKAICMARACSFCFWAKLIVAIPALPLLAVMASMPFEHAFAKAVAAVAAVFGAVVLAVWIDSRPTLSRAIVMRRKS